MHQHLDNPHHLDIERTSSALSILLLILIIVIFILIIIYFVIQIYLSLRKAWTK